MVKGKRSLPEGKGSAWRVQKKKGDFESHKRKGKGMTSGPQKGRGGLQRVLPEIVCGGKGRLRKKKREGFTV